MAERRTIDNWGARLNVKGELLTIEEAKLLSAGHRNAYLEQMLAALLDMRDRLTRMEMFCEERVPGYAEHRQRMERRQALAEARNGDMP